MNKLAQATVGLLERKLLRSARVLAVRTWEPATLLEVDVHMPDCDMSKWQRTQHIKCKVGTLAYRDYTPAGWDADTRTCTIVIDAGHEGPGSQWARGLKAGDTLYHLGVASSHHHPVTGKRMIFLGDETTIGHFLSLQQLAGKDAQIDGAITLANPHHQREFSRYYADLGLAALGKGHAEDYRELEDWLCGLDASPDTVFYVAGYIPAVVRLRKILKEKGYGGGQIRCQGFWN